jgi:GH43 family beta-xylosidase
MQNKPYEDSYTNPVFDRSFPDPFVLKFLGEYWAYCTGLWKDGNCFGILHSTDLVNWQEVGSAMAPLPGEHTCYWAPEVVYYNGVFYLYYSVGDEINMEIRVALSDNPSGPFIDSGRRLTVEQFAIDPHVFTDDNGQRYLFYATDYLEHSHIGTGTTCDLLVNPLTLAGQPHPVTRARYDWQVYDPHRWEKGGVRWHTIEGPAVLKRKGYYYQMFSGGNWQNTTYGMSFAITDNIDSSEEWRQVADGVKVLPVLRTLPGSVIGPGHNSVVLGPNNRQYYCVYHEWTPDNSARVMAVDPLDWAGERLLVLGPTVTPQPVPLQPVFAGFDGIPQVQNRNQPWSVLKGNWILNGIEARQEYTGEILCRVGSSSFLAEINLRSLETISGGNFGIALYSEEIEVFKFQLLPGRRHSTISWLKDDNRLEQQVLMPADFNPNYYHCIYLEVDGNWINIELDQVLMRWQGRLDLKPAAISLFTEGISAGFAGFALTPGWEDSFMLENGIQLREWNVESGLWEIRDRELWCVASNGESIISKEFQHESYELVVNVRMPAMVEKNGGYGFYPAWHTNGNNPLVKLSSARTANQEFTSWALHILTNEKSDKFTLPDSFNPAIHHQFRFRKLKNQLRVYLENEHLGTIEVMPHTVGTALYASGAMAAFEMVRITAIRD